MARIVHGSVAAGDEDKVAWPDVGEACDGRADVLLVVGGSGQHDPARAVGLLDEAYLKPAHLCLARPPRS